MLVLINPLLSEVSGELTEPWRHGFSWLAGPLHSPIFDLWGSIHFLPKLEGDELMISAI